VAFRQINRTTGNRLRQQLIDDVTREPIEAGEKARGYEVGKNQYMLIEEDELDAVTIPDMKLPKDMLQLAEHILETKAGDFELERFEDRYEDAVVEMIQRKRAGMPVSTERIAAVRGKLGNA
jgi:non-homologous end joining protein Ku